MCLRADWQEGITVGKAKRLYAVLWIDDWSSFPLPERDIRWFHENAGSLSLGLEMDERLSRPFKKQFKQIKESGSNYTTDFLSHHFHSVRWAGPRLIKKIYDFLHLRWCAYLLTHTLGIDKWAESAREKLLYVNRSKGMLWLLLTGAILSLLVVSLILYNLSLAAMLIFIVFYAALLGFIGLFLYVQLRNWEYMFAYWEWNKEFLQGLKRIFQEEGLKYPIVVRHGWNLPPASSMEFYLTEMNVLADASATPTPEEEVASKRPRRLTWRNTVPYYASLSGDYDVPWNSVDEEDRGILELPVNLGSIAEHGFSELAKERIEQTPHGGLVSTVIHGWDDFSVVRDWVTYLKKNYDVRFVRADDYAKMYMKEHPRPILIDKSFRASWALKRNGRLKSIIEVDKETVSIELLHKNEETAEIVLNVNTEEPVPEIGIDTVGATTLDPELKIEESMGMIFIRGVKKNTYRLEIRQPKNIIAGVSHGKSLHN